MGLALLECSPDETSWQIEQSEDFLPSAHFQVDSQTTVTSLLSFLQGQRSGWVGESVWHQLVFVCSVCLSQLGSIARLTRRHCRHPEEALGAAMVLVLEHCDS